MSKIRNEKWWQNAVIYQIYPRSFQDSNGDGIGDIPGIISRLDYLENLGVDAIWLSPVCRSPQDDCGYDISDYQDIDTMFGTLEDMDRLIAEAGKRGIGIIMDLVLNHTSDEHYWFRQARTSREDPYHDYYVWRDGAEGTPPNDLKAGFGGSAWEWVPELEQYYLHQFSVKQPDLNWENPIVRSELYEMIRWWMDRGVCGFRLDVIDAIAKQPDEKIMVNGPKLHEYLQEMTRETFSRGNARRETGRDPGVSDPEARALEVSNQVDRNLGARDMEASDSVVRDLGASNPAARALEVSNQAAGDLVTVGETWGADLEIAKRFSDPDGSELSMVFQFEHMFADQQSGDGKTKWDTAPLDFVQLKKVFSKWQTGLFGQGWNSLFWDNHDLPRAVSRWGDDGRYRVESAKMLAIVLHGMQGTPYIYQGEELGMTNTDYDISEYRDIELLNAYQEMTEAGIPSDRIMEAIHARGRDNARTPMQWSCEKNAGFSEGKPWIKVNPNYTEINAQKACADPDSVFHCYKKLIALRKKHPVFREGTFSMQYPEDKDLFVYTRENETEELLVAANFFSNTVSYTIPEEWDGTQVLIHNYKDMAQGELRPYEAMILRRAK